MSTDENPPEESFTDFECPYCGGPVSFPASLAGQLNECPGCLASVIIPGEGIAGPAIPLPVSTARLQLRRLDQADWKDLHECHPDQDEETVLRWLEHDHQVKLTSAGEEFLIGVELVKEGKIIGHVTLRMSTEEPSTAAVNVHINEKYQKKGYGTEALMGLAGFCLQGLQLHRITARPPSRNAGGCRLCEKAGFRREGMGVKDHFAEGEWVDIVWYAMLREEFREAGKS